MNLDNESQPSDKGVAPGLKIKKIALRIDVNESNLANQIRRMFDLAKSSGRELDLTFSQDQGRTA